MNPPDPGDDGVWTFRRILLALDSASDVAAVEQIASLAARLRGELMTLLVEDADLARLAEHGELAAFSVVSATGRPLAAQALRDALRLHAARLRRAMQEAAARQQIPFAFEVRRGRLLAEVVNAAAADDLVVIGWQAGGRAPAAPPAAIAQVLAEAQTRSVLLLHPRGVTGGPVLVAVDGTEAASRTLGVATQFADQENGSIDVVLLHGRVDEAERAAADIAALAAGRRLSLQLIHVPKARLRTLIEIAAARRSVLLVVAASDLLDDEESRRLLPRVPCSLLLVR